MKKITVMLAVALLFCGKISFADDLVPATSEDQQRFDQQIEHSSSALDESESTKKESQGKSADHRQDGDHSKRDHVKKEKKPNFGMIVSAEAKKLKDESKDQRKEMGQWVSDQRRKNTRSSSGAQAGGSTGSSSSNDGRSSAPGLNNSGGSTSSPGQSGNHRK